MDSIEQVQRRFIDEPMTRIVAFGSSNTERGYHCEGHYNWVDWLDVGLSQQYGRKHHTINAGVSGQTTAQCLERFDRDVATYQPHIVIITLGGNDCNPEKNVTIEQFAANLTRLVAQVRALDGAFAVLQTYYSADIEMLPEGPAQGERFHAYQQVARNVAGDTGAYLIDHLARWERLRKADVVTYRALMRDAMHLKPLGNMLMGLDTMRHFGAMVRDDIKTFCAGGLALQKRLDALEAEAA